MKWQITKLIDLDFYTEGPVVGDNGDFFFTTLTGGKVIRLRNPAGSQYELETWALGKCPNGQVVLPNGEHWLCESLNGQIAAYFPDGSFRQVVVENECAGARFSTPNDLVIDSNGNLFFTESVRENGKVFRVGPNGEQQLIADRIDYANGLALNETEDILYVAESYANRILEFHLDRQKNVVERGTLTDLPAHPSGDPLKNLPDGLAIDRENRIWVAHYGMQAVHVIAPTGELLHTIDTGLPLTSNLAFAREEPEEKHLLITGGYGEPGPGAVMLAKVWL